MITIKVSTQDPSWPLLRQTPGSSGVLDRFRFAADDDTERCDYWFVCEGVAHPCRAICPPENLVLLTWEPPSRPPYDRAFLDQFAAVVTCHRGLEHPNIYLTQQALPWHVGRSFDELMALEVPEKQKLLSIITSNKQRYEGHRLRYRFAHRLKEELGDAADLYGRGIKDFDDKWDVLAPYRYSVAIENDCVDHLFTEKLADCYLASCFPLYFGAPNIGDYFPSDAYRLIDIRRPDEAIAQIREVIFDPSHFERSLGAVQTAKIKYLNELSLFPWLARLIEDGQVVRGQSTASRLLTVNPEFRRASPSSRVWGKLRGWGREVHIHKR